MFYLADFLSQAEYWGKVIIAVSGGLGALYGVWKKVAKPMINTFRSIKEMRENLSFIAQELKPNHGTSLRDTVNRIELRQILSDQKQRIFMQELTYAIFETDGNGDNIYVNKVYADWVKRDPNSMLGKGWLSNISEDDRESVRKEWALTVEEKREYSADINLLDSEGQVIPVHIHAVPLFDGKKLAGYMGVITRD